MVPNPYTVNSMDYPKNILRVAPLSSWVLLVLIVVLALYLYLIEPVLKKAPQNFISFVKNEKQNLAFASLACIPEQKSQESEIFFVSCGGMY